MNFIFQGSQKMHVRVAISQKGLVNFFRYAHQIKAFFIPVQKPVSLFMGRFFPLEFHSAYLLVVPILECGNYGNRSFPHKSPYISRRSISVRIS